MTAAKKTGSTANTTNVNNVIKPEMIHRAQLVGRLISMDHNSIQRLTSQQDTQISDKVAGPSVQTPDTYDTFPLRQQTEHVSSVSNQSQRKIVSAKKRNNNSITENA